MVGRSKIYPQKVAGELNTTVMITVKPADYTHEKDLTRFYVQQQHYYSVCMYTITIHT